MQSTTGHLLVPGFAVGGGHSLHVTCDLTLASRGHAVFKQTDTDVASFDGGFGSAYLARQIGQKFTREIFFLGRSYSAEQAHQMGMVNEVVPHDDLMARARALAARIALVPEPSIRLNKAIAMQGLQASGVTSALLVEGALSALAHSSHNDYREELHEAQQTGGVKAYLQMRDGPFQPEPMGPRSAKARAARAAGK